MNWEISKISFPDEEKKLWYRIQARETDRVMLPLAPIGTRIYSATEIIRVGYLHEPVDADEEWIVKNRNRVLIKNGLSASITMDTLYEIQSALGISRKVFWRKVDYFSRGQWVNQKKKDNPDSANMRIAWYRDFDGQLPDSNVKKPKKELVIQKVVNRWQGKYYPPRSIGGGYYADFDFDYCPGGLLNMTYLQVYLCVDWRGSSYLIHPDDATTEE